MTLVLEWNLQNELLEAYKKICWKDYTFICGGRGTAKTHAGSTVTVHMLLTGRSVLVIRDKNKDHINSTYSEIIKRLNEFKIPFKAKRGARLEIRVGNSVVLFGGMRDTSDFKSMRPLNANQIGFIWFEEASQILENAQPNEAIQELDTIINSFGRGQDDILPKVLFTFNPPQPGHWLERKITNKNFLENEDFFRTTQNDNPFLREDYKKTFEKWKTLWPEYYEQQVNGKIMQLGIKVYPTVMDNITEELNDISMLSIGIDLGINDATTFVATGISQEFKKFTVLESWEHSNAGIKNQHLIKDFNDYGDEFEIFHNNIKATYPGIPITIYVDNESRFETFSDILVKKGIFILKTQKGKISNRIMKINYLLRNKQVFFLNTNKRLLECLANAIRDPESLNLENQIRVQNRDTHLIDAFEYSLVNYFAFVQELQEVK